MRLEKQRIVLLDTNALFLPFTTNIVLERELDRLLGRAYELRIPSSVIAELRGLVAGKKPNSRPALLLAQRYPVEETGVGKDASLLELGLDLDAVVVTGDMELKRQLRDRGVAVVYPRGQNHMELDGLV